MSRSFEQLISNNQGRLKYIAKRYGKLGELDDLYQEILLQLWRSFQSFSGDAAIETWVYRVALNTACTFVRKDSRQPKHLSTNRLTENHAEQWGKVTPETAADRSQADMLNEFMDILSLTDASILMMYLDDLSSEQSADVLGISANAVRLRLSRIKTQFEQHFIGA